MAAAIRPENGCGKGRGNSDRDGLGGARPRARTRVKGSVSLGMSLTISVAAPFTTAGAALPSGRCYLIRIPAFSSKCSGLSDLGRELPRPRRPIRRISNPAGRRLRQHPAFLARGGEVVTIVLIGMVFNAATEDLIQQAARDALIAFMAAMAETPASCCIKGSPEGTYRGRKPSYDRGQLDVAKRMLLEGAGASAISKATGLSRQTIIRIRNNCDDADRALSTWGV